MKNSAYPDPIKSTDDLCDDDSDIILAFGYVLTKHGAVNHFFCKYGIFFVGLLCANYFRAYNSRRV